MSITSNRSRRNILVDLICVLILIVVLVPFIWILVSAFKSYEDVQKIPIEYLPKKPTLETFNFILFNYNYFK